MKKIITIVCMLAAFSCTKQNATLNQSIAATTNKSLSGKVTYTLGEMYHGGVIYYIDSTGKHGLIAALNDMDTLLAWKSNKKGDYKREGRAIYDGKVNTDSIVLVYGKSKLYAAEACKDYSVGNYKNWYLPSIDEMKIMFQNRAVVPNLVLQNYWTSSAFTTEREKRHAIVFDFLHSLELVYLRTYAFHVRAISYF